MDLIEKQVAIDALKGLPTWWADRGRYYGGAQPPMVALLDPKDAVSAIENLPPAHPEIIRCKDCRYSEYDALYDDRYCHYDGKADIVPDEHYCGYVERRTDERKAYIRKTAEKETTDS